MVFFYSDNEPRSSFKFSTASMNGTKAYLKHYDNYLYLQFVTNNDRASEVEKRQARHEMTICERKLAYWQRHPNYLQAEALRGVDELKKNWTPKKGE